MARDVSRLRYDGARVPGGLAGTRSTVRAIKTLIRDGSRDWIVRRRAMEIAAPAGSKDTRAEIAAIFDFMAAIPFRSDPHFFELVETPQRALAEIDQGYGFGFDCDGYVTTAGALLRSIGIPVRIVLIGNLVPDSYQHIYLEAYDTPRAHWIPFDPSVPGAPLGWQYETDRIVSKWIEPFTVADELAGPFPAAEVERHAPGQVAAVGVGLAGLGQVRPVGFLQTGQPDVTTGRELPGLLPAEAEHRVIDFSNLNQELFILLTRPDANPRRLRRLFGFKRSPEQRRIWRRERDENRDKQNGLPRDVRNTLGKEIVKVPNPGHTDGNSVARMLEHFEQFFPLEEVPEPPEPPREPVGPTWADIVPDPEQFFSNGLWNQISADILIENITVQQVLDVYQILTGRDLNPELNGTALASQLFVDLDAMVQQTMIGSRLGIAPAVLVAILAAIASAIAAVSAAIVAIIDAVHEVADPVAAAIGAIRAGKDELAQEGAAIIEGAHDGMGAVEGATEDPVATGTEWLEGFRDEQEEAISLAIARDTLERLYRVVLFYGFDAPEAAEFRTTIKIMVSTSPMLYVLAKERVLRDLRQLKIMALGGDSLAETAYFDLLAEMRRAGPIIKAWADEYSGLAWDLNHVDIPGVPDPNPPTELPPGNWPWTDEDEDGKNPFLDDDEVEQVFNEEKRKMAAGGYTWPGATILWAGKIPPRKERQRVTVAPGISVDVAPGAGGAGVQFAEEQGLIEAGRREAIPEEEGFISRHPIATAAGAAGAGFGLFKLIQYLRR